MPPQHPEAAGGAQPPSPPPAPVAKRTVAAFAALVALAIAQGWWDVLPTPADAGRLAAAAVVGAVGAAAAELSRAPKSTGALVAGALWATVAPNVAGLPPGWGWPAVARAAAAAPAVARAGAAALAASHATAAARKARGLDPVQLSASLRAVALAGWTLPLAAEAAAVAAALGAVLRRGAAVPPTFLAATGAIMAIPAAGVGGPVASARAAAVCLAAASFAHTLGAGGGLHDLAGSHARAALLTPAVGAALGAVAGAVAAGGWRPRLGGGLVLVLAVAVAAGLAVARHPAAGLLAALTVGAAAAEVWLRNAAEEDVAAALAAAKCRECGAPGAAGATSCASCDAPLPQAPARARDAAGADPTSLDAALVSVTAAWTSIGAPLLYALAGAALQPRSLTRRDAAAGAAAAAASLAVRVATHFALKGRAGARPARRLATTLAASRKGDCVAALVALPLAGGVGGRAAAAAGYFSITASHALAWAAVMLLRGSTDVTDVAFDSIDADAELGGDKAPPAAVQLTATFSSPWPSRPLEAASLLPRQRSEMAGASKPALASYGSAVGAAAAAAAAAPPGSIPAVTLAPDAPDDSMPDLPGWTPPRPLRPAAAGSSGSTTFSEVSLSTTPGAASLASTPRRG